MQNTKIKSQKSKLAYNLL